MLRYIGIDNNAILSIGCIVALCSFFLLEQKAQFYMGAFSGLLWFFWVGFSFYYYHLTYLAPFAVLIFMLCYGVLFWFIAFASRPFFWLRIPIVGFLFDYFSPFGFDWLKPEILTAHTDFGSSKMAVILLLTGAAILVRLPTYWKVFSIVFFALSISMPQPKPLAPLRVELLHTDVAQDEKWDDVFKLTITTQNLRLIDGAIARHADVIVLPETAFPYFLNKADGVIDALKERSFEASIVVGGLKLLNNQTYNSTYLFQDGKMYIFDKVVAVPFGEVNPLPKFLSSWVNDIFFGGGQDYKTADAPSDYMIKGTSFRNAICYEATNEKLYQGNPRYMIAMSNNAWFLPSPEPIMQKMLLEYLSKKYATVIYHTTNKTGAYIVQ